MYSYIMVNNLGNTNYLYYKTGTTVWCKRRTVFFTIYQFLSTVRLLVFSRAKGVARYMANFEILKDHSWLTRPEGIIM